MNLFSKIITILMILFAPLVAQANEHQESEGEGKVDVKELPTRMSLAIPIYIRNRKRRCMILLTRIHTIRCARETHWVALQHVRELR